MKKILCPTDFSDTALNAIAYASKLAQITGSSVTLFNIQSMFEVVDELKISTTLELQSQEVTHAFKVPCDYVTQKSARILSNAISEKANGFDLIVMGSNGPDDLYQFFWGSNTYNVIQKSEVPVLIIPSNAQYTEIRSVTYAYDYLRERHLPLGQVATFCKAVKCGLKVLEVMEPASSKGANEDLKQMQAILGRMFNEVIPLTYETIRSDEVARSIDNYMQTNSDDILALCITHGNLLQKIFHKSVVKQISTVCNYPVLVCNG